MDRMISISESGRILGVTPRTLKRWDESRALKVYRTLGNHRRYKLSEVETFLGIADPKKDNSPSAFIYARVSTKKQADKGNLERQKERQAQKINENNNEYSFN